MTMLPNCYQGMPMIQGYTPNVPTAVSFQQLQQTPAYTLKGKVVNRLEDITPNDVPMDGSVGIFPLSDLSKIVVKSWNANGTIDTVVYERPQTIQNGGEIDDPFKQINERFDKLEKLLQPKSAPKVRKEESNE